MKKTLARKYMDLGLVLHVQLCDVQDQMQHFVYERLLKLHNGREPFVTKEFRKYYKLLRRQELIFKCAMMGCEKLNWKVLDTSGELCDNDYKIFKELKKFDPDGYYKRNMIKNSLKIEKKKIK